jgi:hypothetical protein
LRRAATLDLPVGGRDLVVSFLAERTAVVGCSAVAIIAATDARYAAPLAPLIT